MYDINELKELKDPSVGELVEILSKYPKDAKIFCDGDNYFYIHVEADRLAINIDSSSLEELYDESEDSDADPEAPLNLDHEVNPRIKNIVKAKIRQMGFTVVDNPNQEMNAQ